MSPRRLGQHFLANAAWRERILRHLRPLRDQTWLEIGAGHGEMTRELARHAQRVMAVEIDPPLIDSLHRLAIEHPNIEICAADILALDLTSLVQKEKLRVYGSLPYYITSPILRKLFTFADSIVDIHVVIQYEVAARIAARPGRRDFGFLSVLAQYYSRPEIALRIPPGAFRPPPKVASALVSMAIQKRRAGFSTADEAQFLEFAGNCFAQKRKTLLNNLKGQFPAAGAEAAITAVGLRSDARAEQLTVDKFVELFQELTTPH